MTDAYDAVKSLGMFSGARQHQNFSNLKNLLPVAQMQPSVQSSRQPSQLSPFWPSSQSSNNV